MNKYVSKIIELYTKSEVGEVAKRKFHEWLVNEKHLEEKDAALHHLWDSTENTIAKEDFTSFLALQEEYQASRARKSRKFLYFRYVAAILLIGIISSIYIFTSKTPEETGFTEYFSGTGQPESIILPDGSTVLANSGTIILYPQSYGEDTRTVYLSGEANFDVKKNADAPFIVKSKDFSVTALGTEFDVTSYPDDLYFKTTLISGSVKVQQNNDKEGYILKVNEQFVYNRNTGKKTISQIDTYEVTAWQRGELIFRGATMKDVLSALERKYGISFQYRSNVFNDDKYNFRFKKDAQLPDIMDIIKEVADDFDYKQIKDSYYINSKKM